ncbi:MAG: MATE family efflux transporter [Myxococcales bacterium]|nr:MATE family efflux transporter [Myxococcales bacterium]
MKPVPELVRLAWPIAVSMLSYSVMTLVSTLFVGRLGANALAGVGLGGIAAFGLIVFGFGLLRSVKVVVSQATGAGRRGDIPVYLAAGVALALALGLLGIGAGRGLAAFLPRVSASAEAGHLAAEYLWWRNLGAPFVLVAVALREARYGLGDSRSPLVSALGANLCNIALDALFILVLGLGVRGAGAATALAHVVEAALLVSASRSPGFAWARVRLRHVGTLLRLGVPLGLQFLLEIGAFAVLVVVLAGIGAVDLAAHQIALQLTHISFLPALAVGEAASVMVGQAVGAGQDGLVPKVARRALLVATAYTGVCALVFVAFAQLLAGAFTADLAVRGVTVKLLWVAAAFQIFDGANAIARCVLRGTGDVRYPAVIAVVIAWVSTPPLAWFLGVRLGWGALGGWLGLCAEIVVGSSLLWWRLERGSWRKAAEASRERLASEPGEEELVTAPVTS